MNVFHLAITVNDIDKAKQFYKNILGLDIGRQTTKWFDVNFYNHQLTVQLDEQKTKPRNNKRLHELAVPPHHFGIILSEQAWHSMKRYLTEKKVEILNLSTTFFEGSNYEQYSMFVKDPSENMIEFKAFKDKRHIFTPIEKQ